MLGYAFNAHTVKAMIKSVARKQGNKINCDRFEHCPKESSGSLPTSQAEIFSDLPV